jgi:MFS family permease
MLVFDPQKAMKSVTWEGVAASSMFAITNSFLAVFAAALGASNTQIGLLVSVPAAIALLSYLPAGYAIERWNRRRMTCAAASMLSRSMWFLVGLVPFLVMQDILPGPAHSITLLIAVVSAYSLFSAFVAPAWASIVGAVVPENIRGSYFGRRNQLCAAASLAVGAAAGLVVEVFSEGMLGFALIFFGAGAAGMASSYFFSRFPDIRFEPEKMSFFSELKGAFGNRVFRRFILLFIAWQFGVSMSAPFMNVYVINGLGAPYAWISVLVLASGITTIIFQRWWGSAADAFGHRSILIISAFGASFVPLLYMLAPSPGFVVFIDALSGASWAGFNLACFNYLLGISAGGKSTIYSAIYWMMAGVPVIVAPVAGGALVDMLMPVSVQMFSGFRGMFFISWLVRLAAVVLFAYLLVDVPARQGVSVRYVAREIVSTGFISLHHPFQLLKRRGLGRARWLAMKMLGRIKKGG